MPCRDYYDDHPDEYFRNVTEPALKKQISFAESALCAALNALAESHGDPYGALDCESAGITKKQLQDWHKKHKELDKKHRVEELAKKKSAALAKLTSEEKELLGIKE